ncbi:MAG: hypothetical protein RLP15_01210 [Cryomorphaceae bacterium]
MKSLEDISKEDRLAFDDLEPNEGHAQRFRQKLNKTLGTRTKNPMQMMWWAAAVIAGILLVTKAVPSSDGAPEPMQEATIGLSDISPEMAEVESYFTRRIRSEKKHLSDDGNQAEYEQLIEAQLNQLEADYELLRQELNEHQGDQRIVRYMVENYRLRLRLLETHLDKIEKYVPQNPSNK